MVAKGPKRAASEDDSQDYRLPKPSLRVPIALMGLGALGFAALATTMSDIGHAAGSALVALLFVGGALYIAVVGGRP